MRNTVIKNPLFESLVDTAKKYERIQEATDPEYKMKYAKDYAVKIIQMIYDQYIYFVSSIPSEELKDRLFKEGITFVESKFREPNPTLKGLAEDLMKQWESVSGSISANPAIQNLSPQIKEIYQKVGEGMKASNDALNSYFEKYTQESTSPEVVNKIKTFMMGSLEALKQRKN